MIDVRFPILFIFVLLPKSFNCSKCEPIAVSFCANKLPYNLTILPNLYGHTNQQQSSLEIRKYSPLVNSDCNENVKLFICSLYLPVCTILNEPIPPCRSLCTVAKNGCEPLFSELGIKWPECENFPEKG
ncbi:frizzled-7-like protein, partial [Leptotrombidium deliense]